MGALLDGRRRQIKRRGVLVRLRRQNPGPAPFTYAEVPFLVVLSAFKPDQLTGGVQQGDANLQTLDDEIRAARWPGPPRIKDTIVFPDGKTWAILGAMVVRDGPAVIGHWLWVRGGAA